MQQINKKQGSTFNPNRPQTPQEEAISKFLVRKALNHTRLSSGKALAHPEPIVLSKP